MIKIKVLTIGKTKEKWLNDAIKLYEKRVSHSLVFNWDLVKDTNQLLMHAEKLTNYICLDPKGLSLTSIDFCEKLFSPPQSRISFIIGGDMGIPNKIVERASMVLSLSPLTFTHQITRLILIEQLYRSLEIQKGSKYHK